MDEVNLHVSTSRFGLLAVPRAQVIHFSRGMLGFEQLTDYVLVPMAENPVFCWLQSVQEPDVAFLLADPFLFFKGYEVDLKPHEENMLEVETPDQVVVYTVVTIPPSGVKDMTANLLGPLVFNLAAKRGLQVVLESSNYSTKHLFVNPEPPSQQTRAVAR